MPKNPAKKTSNTSINRPICRLLKNQTQIFPSTHLHFFLAVKLEIQYPNEC